MKTERTPVEGTCYIWAVPKSDYRIQQELDEADGDKTAILPFEYEIRSQNSHWKDGAVLVHEFTVKAEVPPGVDLIKAAVETLRDEIARVRKEAEDKVDALKEQIRNLALIEYKPEETDE